MKPKELVEAIRQMSLSSDSEREEFIFEIMQEHRTNQQLIASMFVEVFATWDERRENKVFDDRNKATMEVAEKVMEATNGAKRLPRI